MYSLVVYFHRNQHMKALNNLMSECIKHYIWSYRAVQRQRWFLQLSFKFNKRRTQRYKLKYMQNVPFFENQFFLICPLLSNLFLALLTIFLHFCKLQYSLFIYLRNRTLSHNVITQHNNCMRTPTTILSDWMIDGWMKRVTVIS